MEPDTLRDTLAEPETERVTDAEPETELDGDAVIEDNALVDAPSVGNDATGERVTTLVPNSDGDADDDADAATLAKPIDADDDSDAELD